MRIHGSPLRRQDTGRRCRTGYPAALWHPYHRCTRSGENNTAWLRQTFLLRRCSLQSSDPGTLLSAFPAVHIRPACSGDKPHPVFPSAAKRCKYHTCCGSYPISHNRYAHGKGCPTFFQTDNPGPPVLTYPAPAGNGCGWAFCPESEAPSPDAPYTDRCPPKSSPAQTRGRISCPWH